MKTFIRKTAFISTLFLTLAASTFSAAAQDNKLVYKKSDNPSIGITIDNATGASYNIKDEKGNVILSGTVKSDKTFFISTSKLGKGTYRFTMGNLVLQEFEIR